MKDTDLHLVEKGYLPYGGLGVGASCVYHNGALRKGATLPQRDIYEFLVKPRAPLTTKDFGYKEGESGFLYIDIS